MKQYSRVHADVDLDALEDNVALIRDNIQSSTQIIAVIKTDGYGHGAVALLTVLEQEEKIWGYAVATLEEGRILRNHGTKKPILILGYSFKDQYEEISRLQIRPSISNYEAAEHLSGIAQKLQITVPVHIKIDTGMSRIGFQVTEAQADIIAEISKLPNIFIEGIFTHFASSDAKDKTFAEGQYKQYQKMLDFLSDRQVGIPFHHVSNSAAIIDLPEYNLDLVRAGIILYGLAPSDETNFYKWGFRPVLSLKSQIVHIKELEIGRSVSYGCTYQLKKKEKIATVPVGYGDGYPRSLSNKGYVLIRGQRAPIRGRICMDQFMVDVSHIEGVSCQDEVTLIGTDGKESITLEMIGNWSERFNYEFACDLGKRIPRNFYKKGKLVMQQDYFE